MNQPAAPSRELERLLAAVEALCGARRPREAEPLAQAVAEAEEGSPEVGVARAALALAAVRGELGDPHDAEALCRRAVAMFEEHSCDTAIAIMRLRVRACVALGGTLRTQGRYREAEVVLREALAVADTELGGDDRAIVEAANNLGVL